MRAVLVQLPFVVAVAALASGLAGQRRGDPDAWKIDPYTKGDEAALARAGYVSFGPFTWADRHDTIRIEEDLGNLRLRWVETAHFKIGSSLPAKAVPRDKVQRRKIAAELEELKQKLPTIKPKTRRLDQWLRLHLFAHRLETLYAEVSRLCGVTDGDFAKPAGGGGEYMGRGPYLGMPGKFLVLLFEKESTCGRYLSTFAKTGPDQPSRWYFLETDCFFFGTAEEFGEGAFRSDEAMHAHVVFNVAHCLLDALKGYSYHVPSWWKEGLCHGLRREVSEKFNNFSRVVDDARRAFQITDWDARVKMRLGHGLVRPLEELLGVTECEGFTLVDHMACWSRVEFLRSLGEDRFALFVRRMKGLQGPRRVPPDMNTLLARQNEAIRAAWGFDSAAALDAAWADYVRKSYKQR